MRNSWNSKESSYNHTSFLFPSSTNSNLCITVVIIIVIIVILCTIVVTENDCRSKKEYLESTKQSNLYCHLPLVSRGKKETWGGQIHWKKKKYKNKSTKQEVRKKYPGIWKQIPNKWCNGHLKPSRAKPQITIVKVNHFFASELQIKKRKVGERKKNKQI